MFAGRLSPVRGDTMTIGVDARSLTVDHLRGMGNYLCGMIGALATDRSLSWQFFSDRPDLPFHSPLPAQHLAPLAALDCPGFRFHTWEQVVLPFEAQRRGIDVLHCAGNTVPLLAAGADGAHHPRHDDLGSRRGGRRRLLSRHAAAARFRPRRRDHHYQRAIETRHPAPLAGAGAEAACDSAWRRSGLHHRAARTARRCAASRRHPRALSALLRRADAAKAPRLGARDLCRAERSRAAARRARRAGIGARGRARIHRARATRACLLRALPRRKR